MTDSPGARIKYLRQISGMSQEELGRRVGVQRAAINKYEKGSVVNIPVATIEKIAKVFDVSPSYIVGWNELDTNPLAVEVKIIQGVQYFYGKGGVHILETYAQLNNKGRKRLDQYGDELLELYHAEVDTNEYT